MAASPEPRKRRYERRPETVTLTPMRMAALTYLAIWTILGTRQMARLLGRSENRTRSHLRALFDGGYVRLVALPRAALAEGSDPNDASLLFGSAPNLYTLSTKGARMLVKAGRISAVPKIPAYGPKNSLLVAHACLVADIGIWLTLTARGRPGQGLGLWRQGEAAAIDLRREQPPRTVRPDAWFVYRLSDQRLVGLVEADRGTEQGQARWSQKLAAYGALFASGRLKEVTGYQNARVLVVTPDARRRDHLAQFIAQHAPPALAGCFWLAERAALDTSDLTAPAWRRPSGKLLLPLVVQAGGQTGNKG